MRRGPIGRQSVDSGAKNPIGHTLDSPCYKSHLEAMVIQTRGMTMKLKVFEEGYSALCCSQLVPCGI